MGVLVIDYHLNALLASLLLAPTKVPSMKHPVKSLASAVSTRCGVASLSFRKLPTQVVVMKKSASYN